MFLSNDELSVKSGGGELMSVTLRSSFSIMSPLTLTDKGNRTSFSYTKKILNGKLHSTILNDYSGERSKSRPSITDQKNKSSSNSKSGSRSKSHRSGSDEDDFNEDSIISTNKYYEIFKDSNPIPRLFKLLKVHFRNAKPSKHF